MKTKTKKLSTFDFRLSTMVCALALSFSAMTQTPPAPNADNINYDGTRVVLRYKDDAWKPTRIGTSTKFDRTGCVDTEMEPMYINATFAISSVTLTGGVLPAGVSIASLGDNMYAINGTPTAIGAFDYTITVAGGSNSGTVSGKITVKTVCPPPTPPSILPEAPDDNYCLSGSICFDVAQTEGGEACGDLLGRTPDFSAAARTYTLSGIATEIKFYVLNDEKNLVKSLTQNGSNTVTVNFADYVNDIVRGKKAAFTLVAQFKDDANTPVQKSFTVKVQDCNCGCIVKSGSCSWITFMCYNLGARSDMSIADQVAYTSLRYTNVAASGTYATDAANVHGDLYQWGRSKEDGHHVRSSQSYPTNNTTSESGVIGSADLDGNGQVTLAGAIGKFIKNNASATYFDWRDSQLSTLWDGNGGLGTTRIKTANDPCPQGWRVPTQAEWAFVANETFNDRTVTGTWANSGSAAGTPGWLFKPRNGAATAVTTANATFFLPAAGGRSTTNSALLTVGSNGYYWSSTAENTYTYSFHFDSSNVIDAANNGRAYGFSVRCVAQ